MAEPASRPAMAIGLLAFLLGLAALASDAGGAATRLREEAFDLMGTLVPPERLPGNVVVVDIDRQSLSSQGAWPWRRGLLATLVSRIAAAKPAVIGVDILLVGPDRRSPATILRAIARQTGRGDIGSIADGLQDDDADLAAAFARAEVVLGLVLDDEGRDPLPFPAPILVNGKPGQQRLMEAGGVDAPYAPLADSAIAVGALSLSAGTGARVRDAPVFVRGGSEVYAGFAFEVFRNALKASTFVLQDDGQTVLIGDRAVPLRESAAMRLHFSPATSWGARTISAADVFEGKVSADRLKDRIVLVGTSAPEAAAFFDTPAAPLTPTVQVQAEILEQLRAGHIPQRVARPRVIEVGGAAILGLAALGAALLMSPLAAAGVLGFLVLAWIGTSFALFAGMDRLLDPIGPLVPAVAGANAAALMVFARTRKLRGAIERKFGRYLSPEIVRRLAASPEELKIEGELREVTALFSDIEGFTTMSETAEPRLLVGALDAYFEGVCAIVIRHGGMVDKIVGDAVHGLFNAPLDLPHHARAALDCAVEIAAFTTAFRDREDAVKLGFGRTRIGFETGPVIVGDVGGLGHLDYTAHGDAVNSAARLEAINKQFGTTICLGARAAAAVGDPARLRLLGRVVLRGRGQATQVFTVWPPDVTDERRAAYEAAYAIVESDPAAAHERFAALAAEWPGDPAAAYWVRTLAVRPAA